MKEYKIMANSCNQLRAKAQRISFLRMKHRKRRRRR